jgi:hypothetical protein
MGREEGAEAVIFTRMTEGVVELLEQRTCISHSSRRAT